MRKEDAQAGMCGGYRAATVRPRLPVMEWTEPGEGWPPSTVLMIAIVRAATMADRFSEAAAAYWLRS
jgi:hypothetical protein